LWITICFCRFCQRATGSDRMIEPVFRLDDLDFTAAEPERFTTVSEGSGKAVHVHFCPDCGTKVVLAFERWPDRIGLYAGTIDDPSALAPTPSNAKQIFVSEAAPGSVLLPGIPTFERHAVSQDGTRNVPTIHDLPVVVGPRSE
jgi:hypothetical protein